MTRKNVTVHLVAWSTLVVLIIVASLVDVDADPAAVGEVRSLPVYGQSRPIYKPAVPRLPKYLMKQAIEESSNDDKSNSNPNLVTQTVYGFLDFVTTIGNTVMVFTPQTKKGLEIVIQPSSTRTKEATLEQIKPTSIIQPAAKVEKSLSLPSRKPKLILPSKEESIEVTETEQEKEKEQDQDQEEEEKQPEINEEELNDQEDQREHEHEQNDDENQDDNTAQRLPNLESSEYEPQIVSTTAPVASTTSLEKLKFSKSEKKAPTIIIPEVQTSSKVLQSVSGEERDSAVETNPSEIVAVADDSQKTGLISQIYETKVKDGRTTVYETKVIGTLIGKHYARLFESTSTILPQNIITATKAAYKDSFISNYKKQQQDALNQKAIVKSEPFVKKVEEDEIEPEGGEDNNDNDEETADEIAKAISAIEPTPTATEEQTLYILPEKKEKKAEIYVSPVPNANAYSRQPQLFVDISPAKSSFDFVTATPTTRKQFSKSPRNEYLSRFQQRNNNRGQVSSTESNELTEKSNKEISTEDYNSSRRSNSNNRFRSRNRSGSKNSNEEVFPTVTALSPSSSRRFKGSNTRTRSFSFSKGQESQPHQFTASPSSSFKARSFATAAKSNKNHQISPTTSTSIYRFKLNRPTGRWRYKPSPKPKVNIIKTEEESKSPQLQVAENGPNYIQAKRYDPEENHEGEIQSIDESRAENNEVHLQESESETLLPETLRVATVTPTDFSDLDKYLEIATIKSPYVFQAGNFKNTRYITLTKTFTKENIVPTAASLIEEATLENILATKAPYERILEGSSDVATLPVIALHGDVSTPPLETITQTFSTTQLMLKTSILPVLYEGETTLYTLTQSYFITRIVTAHKTVPPVELFQFIPTKSLNEFNTALLEAGSENREHLLSGDSDNEENDSILQHILAPPDELTLVGSEFDISVMEDKIPKSIGLKTPINEKKDKPSKEERKLVSENNNPLAAEFAGLTPEQIAFLRYFNQGQQQQQQRPQQFLNINQNNHQQQQQQQQGFFPTPHLAPSPNPHFELTSSPVVINTVTTVVESKTLRILFGAKPTHTILYSTRVVPTKVTTYVMASLPVKPTAIPNFFNNSPFPLTYLG